MRTLNRNKTKLWYVTKLSPIDVTDADGNFTGEVISNYSLPVPIEITLYPSNGKIIEQIFGKDVSFDMVAVSTDILLDANTFLFLTEPSSNFETTYTYRIDFIKKSLNVIQYGLRSRV